MKKKKLKKKKICTIKPEGRPSNAEGRRRFAVSLCIQIHKPSRAFGVIGRNIKRPRRGDWSTGPS